MNNDEFAKLVRAAQQDPMAIPEVVSELIDVVTTVDPDRICEGDQPITDMITDFLTPTQMEIVAVLADLIARRRAAFGHQNFEEWALSKEARRVFCVAHVAQVMEEDPNWPRGARNRNELLDYATANHSGAVTSLIEAWEYYRSAVLNQFGQFGAVVTDAQYSTLINWRDGGSQLLPRVADGVDRYTAEDETVRYNHGAARRLEMAGSQGRAVAGEPDSSAVVVRRSVVYGPWYSV